VAGKGVPAALLMAKLSSDTRFCMHTEGDSAKAVALLNNLLYEHTSTNDRFITFSAVVLDPLEHCVTLVSAGHQSPLLYKKATNTLVEAVPKEVSGLPLGMLEGFEYGSCQVALHPGDCLWCTPTA